VRSSYREGRAHGEAVEVYVANEGRAVSRAASSSTTHHGQMAEERSALTRMG
jgi:hypothetical protein